MGFAGYGFNDANYTITSPGDGYLFVQAYANGIGGNMVLATGENSNTADIIFATGGFLTSNEFARIDHVNSAFTLTRTDSFLKFAGTGSISNPANTSLDPINPNVSTMVLTPDSSYSSQSLVLDPTAPGHIHLRAYAFSNIDEPSANIFLGGENTSFEITAGSNNQALIHSNSFTWTFGNDGTLTAPGNTYLEGDVITVGPGADTLANALNNPTLVISSNSNTYIQAAINNVSDIGSADWVAYGHHGNDAGGWADLGFTSASFSDANYTITGAGDGYVFVQGFLPGQAPFIGGGNLVLATGDEGLTKDIIFATGGFLANNEFARIDHANDVFHLTRTGSGIKFQDGTTQNTAAIVWTTAPTANNDPGTAGQAAYDSGGNLYVCVATNTWAKFSGTTSW